MKQIENLTWKMTGELPEHIIKLFLYETNVAMGPK